MTVSTLSVPPSPAKADMLKLLDDLRADVESGDIIGLMVTTIGSSRQFANWSVADVPASSRIGYLMCHVNDLVRSMVP